MRFAVDAHAIGRHLTGNEVYVRSLLSGFSSLDREAEFFTYISVHEARTSIPSRFQTRAVGTNPFLRLGYEITRQVRKDRPDLLHVQYTAPLVCPVPVVATVHDVSFLEHPEYFPRTRAMQLRWSVGRTVERAARVLTGTEFSRSAILRGYPKLDPDKVVVVPIAAGGGFRQISREQAAVNVRKRFGASWPYILSVGDLQPRKNHIGLIAAYARMIRENPQFPHHLMLAGKPTWFAERVYAAAKASGVEDRIHFAGFVTDEELLHLYNGCEFFIFPSYYEGFGLPPLEAMTCGRAVACANTSATPEVVDGAGILFDPYSEAEIKRAMMDLIADAELRARMERLGQKRASHFSWQKTAEQVLAIYYEIAGRRPRTGRRAPAASIIPR
jgi:glycosyltransferase involved in cell wall biosynthesis